MKYLLDTCVISELINPAGNRGVTTWLDETEENSLFLSVLTIGEIHKGISKLPDSKKKKNLESWVEQDLKRRFSGRIIDITENIAIKWGNIQGDAEKIGKKMPAIDSLLAATAIVEKLVLVTRNDKNVEFSGCEILNPWE